MPYADPLKALECKKRWRAANREKTNDAVLKRYREDPEFRARKLAHYKANKEKLKAKAKARYYAKRQELLGKAAEYRAANKDRIKAYFKRKYDEAMADPAKKKAYLDSRRAAFKAWQERNRAKLSESQKYRYHKNHAQHRAKVRIYWGKKYKSDIQFNISVKLRNRVKSVLRGKYRSTPTLELIGCSLEEFRVHFESKFTDGMTWELFFLGKIHIDHEKPIALFDLTDYKQQRECFNFRNLQPLWARDNISKGKKFPIDTK